MIASNKILVGDNRKTLKGVPDASVHMVITSPPYWMLRAYLTKDHPDKALEIGSEPTLREHIDSLRQVFGECRRVLRHDGLFFLNYGDKYSAASTHAGEDKLGPLDNPASTIQDRAYDGGDDDLDAGQLIGLPWKIAMALQADGWILRSAITWAKGVSMRAGWDDGCEWAGGVMPESVQGTRWMRCKIKIEESKRWDAGGKGAGESGDSAQSNGLTRPAREGREDGNAKYADCPGCAKCEKNGGYVLRRGSWRPTAAYEMLFMFSKGLGYYADGEGVKEQVSEAMVQAASREPREDREYLHDSLSRMGKRSGNRVFADADAMARLVANGRNLRNVWCINTRPSAIKHFAMYPEELVEPAIKIATSDHGCCPHCGANWARVIESESVTRERPNDRTERHQQTALGGGAVNSCGNTVAGTNTRTIGWRPTCSCPEHQAVPCVVLDPFGGAGTTALVARKLGRSSIICELNDVYADAARERVGDYAPLFAGATT